ncbi:hypothetical protein LLEC1_06877 [Akanthomyces lecanii]|uniref:Small ribosomal subunit protein mS29 n=1 Tax=Cordyceps confragosa TaxID=2714763 RepID=A0A179IAW2_CORDF|nr:hypothetical protein LLEC1_06877 [Akanthomyces lecanii]
MAANSFFKAVMLRPALPRAPRIQPVLIAIAPLSTTSSLAAGPPSVKSRRDIVKPTKKTFNKKRLGLDNVKKPAPGERKAFRKRITLSSNSALAVEGLQAIEGGVLADAQNAATVVQLPDQIVDQLRTLGAFRSTQSWGLFRKPHVLVRKETVEMIALMDKSVFSKQVAKIILTGSRASGKSTALVQAMSHALKNDWVVINIPEAQDLVIAHTDYVPVPNTEPMQFTQPTYTLNLLQNILKANRAALEKLKVEQKSSLTGGLPEGSSLADLVVNIREPDAAWPGFLALWSELMLPGRPPVLMAMDGLTFANKDSAYRDPAFNKVHAHNLTLVGHFFAALAGSKNMPNGGANCRVVRLEGVSKDEARALMEYWGDSGLVRSVLSAELVAQKWALGGHGNIGEMERVVLQNLKM